jgi:hypothetical protein
MGGDSGTFIANLYLLAQERKFILKMRNENPAVCRHLQHTFRFIDDNHNK